MNTALIDPRTGKITLEGDLDPELLTMLREYGISGGKPVNCGKPLPTQTMRLRHENGPLRVHRIYHRSVTDGPGMRSVLQVQGCPIRCEGCYVPQTHDEASGYGMTVDTVVAMLLAGPVRHDGVTILGGEPMAQAEQLVLVANAITGYWHRHLTLYTGYTVERIREEGTDAQKTLLLMADIVIDGPFDRLKRRGAGEWRGSHNQRVLESSLVRDILFKRG